MITNIFPASVLRLAKSFQPCWLAVQWWWNPARREPQPIKHPDNFCSDLWGPWKSRFLLNFDTLWWCLMVLGSTSAPSNRCRSPLLWHTSWPRRSMRPHRTGLVTRMSPGSLRWFAGRSTSGCVQHGHGRWSELWRGEENGEGSGFGLESLRDMFFYTWHGQTMIIPFHTEPSTLLKSWPKGCKQQQLLYHWASGKDLGTVLYLYNFIRIY